MAGDGEGPAKTRALTGDRAIAALLLSIDQELAARVLKQFSEESVDRVTRAMQELQEVAIDRAAIRGVYQDTVQRLRTGDIAIGDVGGAMRSGLGKAFGESGGDEV